MVVQYKTFNFQKLSKVQSNIKLYSNQKGKNITMTSTALMVIIIAVDFCEARKGEMISFKTNKPAQRPSRPSAFSSLAKHR